MKHKKARKRAKKKSFTQTIVAIAALGFLLYLGYQNLQKGLVPVKTPAPTSSVPVRPEVRQPLPIEWPPITAEIPLPKRFEVWSSLPKITIVIDDIGNNRKNEASLRLLGNNVTYAILPRLRYSTYFSRLSLETGAEVILHQPFESINGTEPGPGLIVSGMPDSKVHEMLAINFASVPQAIGMNNHMGSRATSDARLMEVILKDLKKRHVFFLDSRTIAQIVSPELAPKIGVPVLERNIFLDNLDTEENIREQVHKLSQTARDKGFAIGIGHDRHNTLKVLYEEIPALTKNGFQIVSLSDLANHHKK